MPEFVSLDKDAEVIKIDSFGVVTKDDLIKSLQIVLEFVQESGYDKVLINTVNQLSMPSISDLHIFSSLLSRKCLGLKHAVIVSQHSKVDARFVETVSRNRGMNMMIFETEGEAIGWLNQKPQTVY